MPSSPDIEADAGLWCVVLLLAPPFWSLDFSLMTSLPLLSHLGPTQINQVVSHPNQPLTLTAHDDRGIRFLDNRTGEAQPSLLPYSPVLVGGGGGPDSGAEPWCPRWRL